MTIKFYIDPEIDLLPPTDDDIFKSLLTRNEPESKIVLMDIISSIIGRKVEDVVILNNELPVDDINQKQERLDVNCKLDNGEFVNIEMQASRFQGFDNLGFFKRLGYYACDLYSSQGIRGKGYKDLRQIFQITFVDFTVYKDRESYINHFKLRNNDGEVYLDDLNIIIIELSKLENLLRKPVEQLSSLELWALFFEYIDNEEKREVLNRIFEVKEELVMAGNLLQNISKDEFERARFLSKRKYLNDLESSMIGMKKEGKKEAALEIAKGLIGLLDDEVIAEKTGLTLEEVLKLKN